MRKSISSFFSLALNSRLFWALFLPPFIISTIASLFLLYSRFSDLDNRLHEHTSNITQQVTTTSEYAIVFSDKNMIDRILQSALNNQDIDSVQIYNSQQDILAELGKESGGTPPLFNKGIKIIDHSAHLEFISAIYYSSSYLEDELTSQNNFFATSEQRNLIGWARVKSSKSNTQIQKYQYLSLVLFIFLLFNIISCLAALRLSKHLLQPVTKLANSLHLLVKGQFSAVKIIELPPEYEGIQKDILDLMERLEKHKEELLLGIEQSTEDMRRSMDSMEEKSAQLHIANREATESNRLKSQFLANISHEVRTPLNAILGYTKTLQKVITDKQQLLYVDTVEQSTNNLLAIIGDILDFSKIEAGKLSLESNHFNIKSLIDDVYQTLSINLLSKEKQIDLVPEFGPEIPEWFVGDITRVRQILTNLIGNAIKFTHQGSVLTKVNISAQSSKETTLSFQIIDTGIGIPEHKMNRLFKPFSQVDTSTTRQFGGTGLGLVITKKLVEQMNGKIEVSSDPTIGSTFRFTIDLKPSTKSISDKAKLNKHIILLEPSTIYKSYMQSYLNDVGVDCTACSDLEQVVSAINKEAHETDAILLSTAADEQSLLESKELILYIKEQFNIPCILMIQSLGHINHDQDIKNLCSDILLKPISHERLYSALNGLHNTQKDPITLPTPKESPEEKFNGLKVLAVDDTAINLQLLNHWLEPNGIDVSLAYSGIQALKMAKKEQFDLIFMDIQMPEMDGMETTRQLRLLNEYENTPIIALTAHALGSEQQQILSSGMNAYLTKPVDENILLNTIDTWHSNTGTLQDQIEATLVDIFDLEKALRIVNGKVDIAKEMFDILADSLVDDKKLVQHHLEHQDTIKLIEVVHRIHGASKYSGTINIARHAEFLETHLKELGLEHVEGVAEDFIKAIEDLLNHRKLIPWPQSLDSRITNA